jgi:hypothetical protein
MGMAMMLAMERHHGAMKKADTGAAITKMSEATVKGFFPALDPQQRRSR